jgi:prepilin-type processing-associated H-X9-DG protein
LSKKRLINIEWLHLENEEEIENRLVERTYRYKGTGAVYSGTWLGGLRHGKRGIMTFADGAVYDGEWYLGRAHGKGSIKLVKAGESYVG